MIYISSLAALHLLVLVQWVRVFQKVQSGAVTRGEGALTTIGLVGGATLASVPVLMEMMAVADFGAGQPVSRQHDSTALWCLGLAGGLTFITFAARLYRSRATASWMGIGVAVTGVLIGCYLLVVVVDQIRFYSGEDSGTLNWVVLSQQGMGKGIECPSDMLLVSGFNSDVLTYRCPHPGIVLGRFSSQPIAPWPSYTEGKSSELAADLRKMLRQAQ